MLQVIETDLLPILQQLKLEEALLRTNKQNWCLINRGTPPAIVMGISQDPNLVVDFQSQQKNPIPLIRRYSGGGTVVLEPTTVLVTLILNHDMIDTLPFPKDVLKWTEGLYRAAFTPLPFSLRENDYVLGIKKCGGNAQYFANKRIVHHTSFVWDYSPEHMSRLQMPPKMPEYRKNRPHHEFLAPLKYHFDSPKKFSEAILGALAVRFPTNICSLQYASSHLNLPHRGSTLEILNYEYTPS